MVGALIQSLFLAFMMYQAPDPMFRVTAGGSAVELHDFPGGVFGQVEITRPITVEVRAAFDIRWVDIRPKSAGITPVIAADHSSFRFQLSRPVPLTLEFNGDWRRVIHLFANPPEQNPLTAGGPNVRYFGPGVHEAGSIELKDGETLYLARGAWVKGIVNSVGTKNVTIRGRGVLDASGVRRQGSAASAPIAPAPAAPAAQPGQAPAQYGARRNMIYLEKTEGARVEGITMVNSPTWTVLARNTTGTRIDGVRILNGRGPCTTDGIDLVSSSDALVENVFIRTNDDNVVIKNSDSRDIRDVTVRRAVFWNEPCGNAIEIGFELRTGTIERIRFEDIDIIRVERGAALSIHNGDSASVRDVVFHDIRVEDARHKLIDFALVYGQYGPDRPESQQERTARMDPGGAWDGVLRCTPEQRAALAKYRGHIRDVRVTKLQVLESLPFSVISGWDAGHAVENVVIEGMTHLGRPVRGAAAGKFSIDDFSDVKFR
jgi:hypothetical protein